MQTNSTVAAAIQNNIAISDSQKVEIEWNQNTNIPVDKVYVNGNIHWQYNSESALLEENKAVSRELRSLEELFPSKSVINFLRPGEYEIDYGGKVGGIVHARPINGQLFPSDILSNITRKYFPSSLHVYKYYSSKDFSGSGGAFTSPQSLRLDYFGEVEANRIVVKFETSTGIPKNFTVKLYINGSWVTIHTNTNNLTDGGLSLFYNGTSWSTTKPANMSVLTKVNLSKIEVSVSAMSASNAPLEIIEISPRLVHTMTSEVIEWDLSKELYNDSEEFPVGSITTNGGNLELDNTNNQFNKENNSSVFKNVIKKHGKVRIWSTIAGQDILQFTGYIDDWQITPQDTAKVSFSDITKYMQNIETPEALIGKKTLAEKTITLNECVRRAFDSFGFNDLVILDESNDASIVYFWMNKEESIFSSLQELMKAHQCTLYTDEFGRIIFKTRSSIFDTTNKSWNFIYSKSGSREPDIKSVDLEYLPAINKISVNYKHTDYQMANDFLYTVDLLTDALSQKTSKNLIFARTTPITSFLWNPASSKGIILGAVPLNQNMTADQNFINLNPETMLDFDREDNATGLVEFSSYLYINEEILKYEGVEFAVFRNGVKEDNVIFKNQDEFVNFITVQPPTDKVELKLTGKVVNVTRGMFDTVPSAHSLPTNSNAYSKSSYTLGGSVNSLSRPEFNALQSTLTIKPEQRINNENEVERLKNHTIVHGSLNSNKYEKFESRIVITNSDNVKDVSRLDFNAGIVIDYNPNNGNGYYISIGNSEQSASAGYIKVEKIQNGTLTEVGLANQPILKNNNVDETNINPNVTEQQKQTFIIETGIYYSLSVRRYLSGGKNNFNVYLNNQLILQCNDSGSALSPTSNAGLFIKGDSQANFLYLAGWQAKSSASSSSEYTSDLGVPNYFKDKFYALLQGKSREDSVDSTIFEFWPYFKEIRYVEAKFDKSPAANQNISNGVGSAKDSNIIITEEYTPFRSSFYVANIINNVLDLTYKGVKADVNYPYIFGNVIVTTGINEKVANFYSNGLSEKELVLDYDWIQSEDQATKILDFIKSYSAGVKSDNTFDEVMYVNLESFSNPLLQVGDIVTITYPDLGFTNSSNSFIITKIRQTFEKGLQTEFGMREIKV
jgi:hypothetical protein